MRHFIIVAVLVVIVSILVSVGLQNAHLLPKQASQEGVSIDSLFRLHIQIIAFLFALIVVFTLYSVIVFRRKPGDTSDGVHTHGNTRLEVIWTVIPLIAVLYFGILGAQRLGDITAPAPQSLVVEVTAQQFAWSFNYPDYGITSAELVLPRGLQVDFKLKSLDVIHSFWVPEFRVKQDAVPGMSTELRITPSEVGEYKVRCAELCGTSHYAMVAPVRVVEPADFEAWVAEHTASSQLSGPVGSELATSQTLSKEQINTLVGYVKSLSQ